MPVEFLSAAKLLLDAAKLLDGKFTDQDRREYTKLLRALTNFRLLTSPDEAENAGAVVASTQKLRELLNTTAQGLPQKSGLERGVLALGQATRQFLTEVESIEGSIRHQLDLIVANIEVGVHPNKSSARLLTHWKRNGYPDHILRDNYKLKVMNIEWEGYRIQFLVALGNLRGQVSVILSALCEVTAIELPEELSSLTPGLESLSTDA